MPFSQVPLIKELWLLSLKYNLFLTVIYLVCHFHNGLHISNLNIYVVKPTIPVKNLGEEPEEPGAPLILGEKKESQKKGRQATKYRPPPLNLELRGGGGSATASSMMN